jgi:DNA-binding NarL/FixJ family response regulator
MKRHRAEPPDHAPPRAVVPAKRIYIVDQHTTMRASLGCFINTEPTLQFCGSEGRPERARAAITRLQPDLVVTSITLPSPGGFRFIEAVRREFPAMPVVAYSMHNEAHYVRRALAAGASAYVLKEEGSERLLHVIDVLLFGNERPPRIAVDQTQEAAA